MVPRQDDHHSSQIDLLESARPVRQHLHRVRCHRVRSDTVLDRPERAEPKLLGKTRGLQVLGPNVMVGLLRARRTVLPTLHCQEARPIALVWEEYTHADLHLEPPIVAVVAYRGHAVK